MPRDMTVPKRRPSEKAIVRKTREILLAHKGKKNAILSRDLARELRIVEGDTFIRTRSIIDKVMRLYGLPIAASTNAGYFFIITPGELFEYMGSLDHRKFEIEGKKRLVYRNYVKHYGEVEGPKEDE